VGPNLEWISESLWEFIPELILAVSILLLLGSGLIKNTSRLVAAIALVVLTSSFVTAVSLLGSHFEYRVFHGMARNVDWTQLFKLLFIIGGILTVLMSLNGGRTRYRSEYFALIIAIVLGACLLSVSTNFIMAFISLEVISISSYVLAGFSFDKKGAEGSLKYFLFGSVASAVMLYGFSILYGLTGIMDFQSEEMINSLAVHHTPMFMIGAVMVFAGFLFKIVAVPMHPWSPDVYESASMPVIALFSVVPKLAGIAIFYKFVWMLSASNNVGANNFQDAGPNALQWQVIVGVIAFLTITVGNFSALLQKNAKRMMAYSSIAQAGFLLIGVYATEVTSLLFYSAVYLIMNYVVFLCLQYFERCGIDSIERFSGIGKITLLPSIILLVGLVSLVGLPPTGGFIAKLFIFSSLWKSYEAWGKIFSVVLLVFGLLNTVVSLFFYLKIPYYAFLKTGEPIQKQNILTFENLLALLLVLVLLALFFQPGLLMGWINRTIFAISY
jgi:NADH-quinone oxidoreductase subunit N